MDLGRVRVLRMNSIGYITLFLSDCAIEMRNILSIGVHSAGIPIPITKLYSRVKQIIRKSWPSRAHREPARQKGAPPSRESA